MISDCFFRVFLNFSHKLTDQILKLEYENGLLVVEKEMLLEKVEGFYEVLSDFVGKESIKFKLEDEVKIIFDAAMKISQFEEEASEKLDKVVMAKEEIQSDFSNLSILNEMIMAHKEKMQKLAVERIKNLQKEVGQLREERDKLVESYEETKKRLCEATEELKTIKSRQKKSKVVKSSGDEKFCVVCFQVYTESSNFNWSCRTHKSQFNENRYWCCNSEGKNAPGCIFSKHTANEELLELEEEQRQVKFCSGCKETGHSIQECYKDPNVQTRVSISGEMERLKILAGIKKKNMNFGAELQERAIELVKSSQNHENFNRVLDTEEEVEEIEGVYFRDVADLKDELEMPNGFVQSVFKKRRFFKV